MIESEPILQVINVSKSFGGLKALEDVSLNLHKGEILGLIGPNGSGKTTLINIISGFIRPNSGRIIFKKEDITGKPPHYIVSKGIVRTFQVTRPFKELTVLSNVTLGALYKVKDLNKAKQIAFEILKQVGLYDKKDSLTKDLSLPDKRKLELARALAIEPEVILLDEVLAGLTFSDMEMLLNLVDRIRREKKISIMIIEHVVKAIMKVADRIVVLNAGRKIAEGRPEEVASNKEVIKIYLGKLDKYLTFSTKVS